MAFLGAGNGSLSTVDAFARAGGSQKSTAVQIGKRLFQRRWAAQILKVYVDAAGSHRIAGVMLSGVKFHRPLTRTQFTTEAVDIIEQSFAAAPVEEVDLWCVVPLNVAKGVIVSGDNAQPTNQTVFAVTVRRAEAAASLAQRIREGKSVYWDASWAARSLVRGHEPGSG
ncbi:MAG: hypothetical protein NVSMB31_00620 [Vulcanimicrobiaceae bacterium]